MFFNLDQTGLTHAGPKTRFLRQYRGSKPTIFHRNRVFCVSPIKQKKPQVAGWGENNREKSMSEVVNSGENSDIPS
ncbi:MAG TPA: hypothetical protein DDW76_10565 [Cyanobacteria bacterium UBA11369]|nr:hypothetical protein [Cyanobacteria bacterium UBA11371]HBE29825.1 hypothetical protein [Cyanobacteria bacterium UBA11368]HBE49214.1 hypothetical protein [Cyanobacteria bacterium UBA11369]